jgi:hypothetical protein
MLTIAVTHIWLDEDGVAWIDDTTIKVIEIAIDKIATGSSPEEMHFQHPRLSLAQYTPRLPTTMIIRRSSMQPSLANCVRSRS